MSKRKNTNTNIEDAKAFKTPEAWKTAEERAKEKCTWVTKEEREENLAALERVEFMLKMLNLKPTNVNRKTTGGGNKKNNKTKPKKPDQRKDPKYGGNKKNNKTKSKK
tara:strand:+ start:86 stop:409 length:324 start_codon:yes stop_codon:yes gene_type:complete